MTSTRAVYDGAIDAEELAELEDQREFLLRSIEDLDAEHEAGDLDDTDYRALRDDYTARAGQVLRAIEERRVARQPPPPRRRWGRAATISAAVVVLAAVAGVLIARSSGQRGSGDTVSGTIRSTPQQEATQKTQQCIPLTMQLLPQTGLQAKGANPTLEALKCYSAALKVDPGNAKALAWRGFTSALFVAREPTLPPSDAQALVQRAHADLGAAQQASPSLPDARAFTAIVDYWQGDTAGAKAAAAQLRALKVSPDQPIMRLTASFLPPDVSGLPAPASPAPSSPAPSS